MNWKRILRKVWYFIWEDNSIWSWIVNIILAYILIKYLVYPGLGLLFGTSYPIVAVVSSSMEHNTNFNDWYDAQANFYAKFGISKDNFETFPFKNGFNKGDIMLLKGIKAKDVNLGNVIVFKDGKPDPFIHRVILKWKDTKYHFQTKGDNNEFSLAPPLVDYLNEKDIKEEQLIGKAIFRIPFLGYIKIWFVDLLRLLHIIS